MMASDVGGSNKRLSRRYDKMYDNVLILVMSICAGFCIVTSIICILQQKRLTRIMELLETQIEIDAALIRQIDMVCDRLTKRESGEV